MGFTTGNKHHKSNQSAGETRMLIRTSEVQDAPAGQFHRPKTRSRSITRPPIDPYDQKTQDFTNMSKTPTWTTKFQDGTWKSSRIMEKSLHPTWRSMNMHRWSRKLKHGEWGEQGVLPNCWTFKTNIPEEKQRMHELNPRDSRKPARGNHMNRIRHLSTAWAKHVQTSPEATKYKVGR